MQYGQDAERVLGQQRHLQSGGGRFSSAPAALTAPAALAPALISATVASTTVTSASFGAAIAASPLAAAIATASVASAAEPPSAPPSTLADRPLAGRRSAVSRGVSARMSEGSGTRGLLRGGAAALIAEPACVVRACCIARYSLCALWSSTGLGAGLASYLVGVWGVRLRVRGCRAGLW